MKKGIPSVPTDEVVQEIINEVNMHMYCDQWATCCVCDQRAPSMALPGQAQTLRFFSPEALPSSAYTVLRAPAPSGLPGVSPGPGGTTSVDTFDQALLDQYNVTLCPDIQDYFASGSAQTTKDAECLKLLLLSPRGIERTVREDGTSGLQLRVCVACQQALKRQHKKPPTFAIANKFLIGQLPDHLRPRKLDVTDDPGTTQLEFDLIRPIYLGSGWILVVHPGRKAYRASDEIKDKNAQKALSGHWYCTELDTSEVAAKMGFQGQVPLTLENVPLRAVLTGALTAEQRKRVLSSFEVRRAQVTDASAPRRVRVSPSLAPAASSDTSASSSRSA